RHTRFSRDWSSDVCSSDLPAVVEDLGVLEDRRLELATRAPGLTAHQLRLERGEEALGDRVVQGVAHRTHRAQDARFLEAAGEDRSEERRVGKAFRAAGEAG